MRNLRKIGMIGSLLAGFILVLIVPQDIFAQTADLHNPSGTFTGLLDLVKNSASKWDDTLRSYAKSLFGLLAGIQFVWTFFPLMFRQGDLGEVLGELIRFIMVTGFFFALLLFSSDWAELVVNSFRQAAATATGLSETGIRPGDVFGVAVELANTVGDVETWNPVTATMIALSALVVLVCFSFIAAFMGLTLIESYVVIYASTLFMGFGGASWTRDYALAIVRYAISVGAKLFILTLIVGLIIDSAKEWVVAYNANADDASMWTLVGLSLTCAYLAKTIPELLAGMISGASTGGGVTLGGMATAMATGAMASFSSLESGLASLASSAGEKSSGAGNAGLADTVGQSLSSGSSAQTSSSLQSNPMMDQTSVKDQKNKSKISPLKVAHTVASGMTRTAGVLSAIAVPGMEGAAGLSLGSGMPQPITSPSPLSSNSEKKDLPSKEENMISSG